MTPLSLTSFFEAWREIHFTAFAALSRRKCAPLIGISHKLVRRSRLRRKP
jgi:hypothetical protein